MAIESPCVKLCEIDPAREICRGCGRTPAEIGAWLRYSVAERRLIMAELPARLAQYDTAREAEADARHHTEEGTWN